MTNEKIVTLLEFESNDFDTYICELCAQHFPTPSGTKSKYALPLQVTRSVTDFLRPILRMQTL